MTWIFASLSIEIAFQNSIKSIPNDSGQSGATNSSVVWQVICDKKKLLKIKLESWVQKYLICHKVIKISLKQSWKFGEVCNMSKNLFFNRPHFSFSQSNFNHPHFNNLNPKMLLLIFYSKAHHLGLCQLCIILVWFEQDDVNIES